MWRICLGLAGSKNTCQFVVDELVTKKISTLNWIEKFEYEQFAILSVQDYFRGWK
jgi:hypothetical protein